MIRPIFKPEWRTQNRKKRKFYAKYMVVLERFGYVLVTVLAALLIAAFNYDVDNFVSAENVAIEPASVPLSQSDEVLVVKVLVEDFQEVEEGQPLMEVIAGKDQIDRYQQRLSELALSLRSRSNLVASGPVAQTAVLNSPAKGTLRLLAKEGERVEADQLIAKIADYNDLRMDGEVGGETVAKAAAGQTAKITNIIINSEGGTTLRAEVAGQPGTVMARGAFGDKVKQAVQENLADASVKLRDDIPLPVSEVTDVEVETTVRGSNGQGSAINLDPNIEVELKGTVLEGEHVVKAQIASLPPAAREAAEKAVRDALVGKTLQSPGGKGVVTVQDVENTRIVVKVKGAADGKSTNSGPVMNASSLDRKFKARIKLDSPPQFLIERLKAAHMAGQTITAKLELRTDSRPIAFRLLRRS